MAKEVVFSLLTPSHRTSHTMHTKYEKLVGMAQLAQVPGVAQVLLRAILEWSHAPSLHGPTARVVRTAKALWWAAMEDGGVGAYQGTASPWT